MPGGGVEPDEETSVTAVREVLEEAGVVGVLGRCLGVFEVTNWWWCFKFPSIISVTLFQNREHKHRTKVFVMQVTEELENWEDSRQIGRKRQWFTIDSALEQLARHKPVQRHYLQQLRYSKKLGRNLSNCPSTDGCEDSIFQHDEEFIRHDAELKGGNSNEGGEDGEVETTDTTTTMDDGGGGGGGS